MVRTFALVFGVVYLLVGIAGFIPGLNNHDTTDLIKPLAVEAAHGRLMGLFPVNAMHNIVHILIGIWGIVGSRSLGGARLFARGVVVLYGLLTIMGLLPMPAMQTMFGLAPLYSHDIWLHALSALVAAYFGFVARDDGTPAATTSEV